MVAANRFAAAATPDTGVCDRRRVLRIPYHNKADGFMAAVLLAPEGTRGKKLTSERARPPDPRCHHL